MFGHLPVVLWCKSFWIKSDTKGSQKASQLWTKSALFIFYFFIQHIENIMDDNSFVESWVPETLFSKKIHCEPAYEYQIMLNVAEVCLLFPPECQHWYWTQHHPSIYHPWVDYTSFKEILGVSDFTQIRTDLSVADNFQILNVFNSCIWSINENVRVSIFIPKKNISYIYIFCYTFVTHD